jgi:hypothetical protein
MIVPIKHDACRSPELQPLLKKGISIAYAYHGNDGTPIATITLTPAECGY